MESQEEREVRKERSQKKTIGIIVGTVLVAGGIAAAYFGGVIPGFGKGETVANELKAEIESWKGTGLEKKIEAYYQQDSNTSAEDKAAIQKFLEEQVNLNFAYTELKTTSGDGKGTVEIIMPKLEVAPVEGKTPGVISTEKLVISRDVLDKNHYFYHTEGNIDVFGDINGARTKLISISGEEPSNEVKIGENGDGYFKAYTKNLKIIEGRGNTTLFSIGEASAEGGQTKKDNKLDAYGKLSYKNIMPGDMIKLMLGNIEPISINVDYNFKGDDITPALRQYAAWNKKQSEERKKAMTVPGYIPEQFPQPKIPAFDGNLKLSDLSVMMGNAGLAAKADLVFKKENANSIPSGEVVVKISQYQKLLDYFKRFMPIPQTETDKAIQFLGEIGDNSNGNITLSIKLDGTDKVLIGTRTMQEVKVIQDKYYPPLNIPSGDFDGSGMPAPDVESAPLAEPAPATPSTTVKP